MNNKYFKEVQVPQDINISISKGLNRALKEKKIKKMKRVSVTLSLGIVLASSTVMINKDVSANMKQFFGDIASYFGLEEDMNKYATSINEPITQNGFTISINQVLIDKNKLTISSTLKSEEGKFEGQPEVNPIIKLNDELIDINSNGTSEYINNSTINTVNTYILNNELEGDIDININYGSISVVNESEITKIKGSWDFKFIINADTLKENAVEIVLDEQTKINNDEAVTLKKYSSNEMGAIIEFERSTNNSEYAIKLVGKDDLGNNIEFYTDYEQEGKGTLRLDNVKGRISKEANELSLFIYTSKTLDDNSWKQVGDEFKIRIKNKKN
ncbi:MAG: DUF4179 domain-containing protein [Romboutsia sp.]|uniref:DUF4179 domain-containing protein n=1 Tax=Romboutsia sp. TaxID=1965302 RepID=UPI003F3033CC